MRRKKIGANPGWLDLYVPKRTCRFNDSVPTYIYVKSNIFIVIVIVCTEKVIYVTLSQVHSNFPWHEL